MVTIAEAKSSLIRYRRLVRKLNTQSQRLRVVMTKLYTVGSPTLSDMPKNPSPSNDYETDLLDRKQHIEQIINTLEPERKMKSDLYEGIIEQIDDPDEQAVLQIRYLDCEKWDTVNEILFGDEEDFEERIDSYMRRTQKLHGRALQRFADIANEKKVGV